MENTLSAIYLAIVVFVVWMAYKIIKELRNPAEMDGRGKFVQRKPNGENM